MHDHPIKRFLDSRLETILAELKDLVEHESPSREKGALDALAARWRIGWRALGGQVELKSCDGGGDSMSWAGLPASSGRRRRWCSATSTPSGRSAPWRGCPSAARPDGSTGRASST